VVIAQNAKKVKITAPYCTATGKKVRGKTQTKSTGQGMGVVVLSCPFTCLPFQINLMPLQRFKTCCLKNRRVFKSFFFVKSSGHGQYSLQPKGMYSLAEKREQG